MFRNSRHISIFLSAAKFCAYDEFCKANIQVCSYGLISSYANKIL